jgi:hypothetical protein
VRLTRRDTGEVYERSFDFEVTEPDRLVLECTEDCRIRERATGDAYVTLELRAFPGDEAISLSLTSDGHLLVARDIPPRGAIVVFRSTMIRLVWAAAVLALASPASAQDFATDLRELRLEHHEARQTEGYLLLGWGAANVVGGGIAAAIGREDPVVLSAGLVSAGWGLVNGLLSLILLDLSGSREEDIRAGRLGDLTDPQEVREQAVVDQLRSGQIFALNLGLDVGYIAGGALMYFLGRERDEDPLAAAGVTVAAQGLFLLVFDLVNWLGSNARAEELRDL